MLSEYKISSCDIAIRQADVTLDDLVDVIEGNRVYVPAIYVGQTWQFETNLAEYLYIGPYLGIEQGHGTWTQALSTQSHAASPLRLMQSRSRSLTCCKLPFIISRFGVVSNLAFQV